MKYLLYILAGVALCGRLNAQCPAISNCPVAPVDICDLTPNDAALWNESYWLDPVVSLHDLADAPTDLSITATDSCVGGLQIRFELFLDLDHDGDLETVLNSDSLGLLASGTVPFDNNLGSGVIRNFDERPVPTADKYRFTLEETGTGSSKTAGVRWNSSANPGDYSLPQLPYGTHKIKWYVQNSLQDEVICEYVFTVKDCKKPTVVCINDLAVSIMPTTVVQLWASDFLQYTEDNHTPTAQLQTGIRKAGAGTGFPLNPDGTPQISLLYNCNELGTQLVELWSMDATGNADYCETSVIVQDNAGFCPGNNATVDMHFCINLWCDNTPVTDVSCDITGSQPALPPFQLLIPGDSVQYDSNGCMYIGYPLAIPLSSNYTITPSKDDDPLNGVTVLDFIRISKHILGLEPLGSPYAMIAADANNSRSITTFDILEERKLLTGIYEELPNNSSWRFVDADFVFANPNNPFQVIFPETKQLVNVTDTILGGLQFWAVKVGDVDCSAIPGLAPAPEDREVSFLMLPEQSLEPGETVDVPVYPDEAGAWLGFQLGLSFDPDQLDLVEVVAGALPQWDEYTAVQPRPGELNIVWFDVQPTALAPGQPLFTLRLKARKPLRLSETLRASRTRVHAEAVTADSETRNLQLYFATTTPEATGIGQPQPNPTNGGTMIPLHLAEATIVQTEIRDVQGRLLWHSETLREAGPQSLALPAGAFPETGVYFWQILAANQVGSGKLVVLR